MLTIEKNKFKIKFSEINIRQRIYHKKSIITIMINSEFFPSKVKESIISGAIEIKVDLLDIHSLQDLEDKHYSGNIGIVTISVNNNGIWEHKSIDEFEVHFGKLSKRVIEFSLKAENCAMKDKTTIVSLYSTSSSEKEISKYFDLEDFYKELVVKKEIGNSTICKYYTKM